MTVVIDADVLIAALDGSDAHHRAAAKLFRAWRKRGDGVRISVVNLSEVLVAPARERATLLAAREAIDVLRVTGHRPTDAIGVDAARLRGRHPISLPDAYCLATAKRLGARLVSFDQRVVSAAAAESVEVEAI